jgi:autotransporter-associated beta strand protein
MIARRILPLLLAVAAVPAVALAQDSGLRFVQIANPNTSSFNGVNVYNFRTTRSINDNGVVVGALNPTLGFGGSAYYSINGAPVVTIAPINSQSMQAVAVNNSGLIVGISTSGTLATPWYYKIGTNTTAQAMTSDPAFPVTATQFVFGINDQNTVVATQRGGTTTRGYYWLPNASGLPVNAPTAVTAVAGTGTNTGVQAINNVSPRGVAAGFGQNGSFAIPVQYNLNTPSSTQLLNNGFGGNEVTGINDAGVMVGQGRVTSGGQPFTQIFSASTAPVPLPNYTGSPGFTSSSGAQIANLANTNLVLYTVNDGASSVAVLYNGLTGQAFNLNTAAMQSTAGGAITPSTTMTLGSINKWGQVLVSDNNTLGNSYIGTPEMRWQGPNRAGANVSGDWTTSANAWSWGVTPGAMHPVYIDSAAAGAFTVTLNSSTAQAAELNIGTTGTGTPTLQVTGSLRVTANDGTTFGNYSRWSTGVTTVGALGTLALSGATFSSDGGITVSGAISTSASATSSIIRSSAGTLKFVGGARTITVADGAAAVDLRIEAPISQGRFIKAGDGVLVLAGANTSTSGIQINAGVVQMGSVNALNSTLPADISFGPGSTGILRLNSFAPSVAYINSNANVGAPVIENGGLNAATLTVDNFGDTAFAGTIRDGGSAPLDIVKRGAATLTLSGTNTFTGGLSLTGTGRVVLASPEALPAFRSLSIGAGTTVQAAPSGANPKNNVRVLSFSIAGAATPAGTLDLTTNVLVVRYTSLTPFNLIEQQVAAGRGAAGTWTGLGITSSSAAANPASYALATAEASTLSVTNVGGVVLGPTDVVVAYTRLGDANLDGLVNFDDLLALAANYNQTIARNWVNGDFNYDNRVNFDDLLILAANYNQAAGTPGGTWALGLASVPEPSGLLALGSLTVILSRRMIRSRT